MTHQDLRVVSLVAAVGVMLGGCSSHRAEVTPSAAPASSTKSSTVTVTNADGKSTAELFRGKFAGVDVYDAPGGGVRVKIRNSGTLKDESGDPIYVVDGLEVSTIDGVLHINPSSIAKIEIEKVSTLYGSRGANGVIKITTKR